MNEKQLKSRQNWELKLKIKKSIRTIEEFYVRTGGECYISTSGADSCVLDWLASQTWCNDKIERVSVAGAENRNNIKHLFLRGDTLLKCEADKKEIITKYGYPLISKSVAMTISRYTRTKSEEQKQIRLNGYVGRNGKIIKDGAIPKKYQEFIYAPFEFSEKCCDMFKKKPLKKYEKKTNKKPITGERAEESRNRKKEYLKHGCIMSEKQREKCTPLGFWTEQDIKQCIFENNISIPKDYGTVVSIDDKLFDFTGEKRTGCNICGFGLLFDLNRLDRLKKNYPKEYDYMLNGGQWIEKDLYRWVKFRPNSLPIWSNKYWVPNEKGYGYRRCLEYLFSVLGIEKEL